MEIISDLLNLQERLQKQCCKLQTYLPYLCKILDRIVKANILQYLKTASILSDAQHGFMHRRSCITNMIVAEELIRGMTDQDEPVNVVYLDFSKAFDSVFHRLLVKKMVAMGIHLNISSEIGRPPLERRYRKKQLASGLCAWTPSVPDFYK